MAARSLAELAGRASHEAVVLARTVLEQDVADRSWARQLGPALAQRDVARLLGKSEQAISKDPRLLRLRNRDGRPVYPVFQFDGRRMLMGIAEVVGLLGPCLHPLTVASWLTSRNRSLRNRRPVEMLRAGDVPAVLAVAKRFAARAAV